VILTQKYVGLPISAVSYFAGALMASVPADVDLVLAIGAADRGPDLRLAQALDRMQIISRKRSGSGAFSTSAQVHHASVIDRPSNQLGQQPDLTDEVPMTTAKPLARLYGVIFVNVIFQSFRLLVQLWSPFVPALASGSIGRRAQ
jgi:hypothetical protein